MFLKWIHEESEHADAYISKLKADLAAKNAIIRELELKLDSDNDSNDNDYNDSNDNDSNDNDSNDNDSNDNDSNDNDSNDNDSNDNDSNDNDPDSDYDPDLDEY